MVFFQEFGPLFTLQNVPFQPSHSMLTPEEQINIAETLNLEPPDIHNSMVSSLHMYYHFCFIDDIL